MFAGKWWEVRLRHFLWLRPFGSNTTLSPPPSQADYHDTHTITTTFTAAFNSPPSHTDYHDTNTITTTLNAAFNSPSPPSHTDYHDIHTHHHHNIQLTIIIYRLL
ncbi:hypothetical protein Pmani_021076 [Petrolisthes manimaculis]|uniref:Uncharacterized protein n=1 Tax=Petrolisthes manimaculis TaxID=1843537 RepID=A0AAE1U3K4_9EUCA|nr:hypothetical protein Pmani_021076 [Petrolisthes manimaculis]